jgi:hypothetical protein
MTLVKILPTVPPLPIVCKNVPAPHDEITVAVRASMQSDATVILVFFITY